MPKFAYTAVDLEGRKVKGRLEATTAHRVYTTLLERDLRPMAVKQKKGILKFEITKKKVKRKDLMHFSRQLAVFVRAGIPVLEALEIIGEEVVDKVFKKALEDVCDSLRGGETLAGAAAQHEEAFPNFYIGVLRSAEASGNLDDALEQLASYIERDLEAKRKIVSALIYPAIIFVMGIVTVLVLTIYVLPRFVTFFESMDAKLPLQTRMLMYVAKFAKNYWWAMIGSLLCSGTVLGMMWRRPKGRAFLDKLILKAPAIGTLVSNAIVERFCRVMASMIHTGVPLTEAMSLTADGSNNAVFREGISAARDSMVRGNGLSGPLAETGLFPSAARQMIRVGEETGTLDEQLETAAKYYETELDYQIKRFTGLFEPLVIVIMGVVVGFVAVALVSAMYGIFSQVKDI